MPQDKKSRARRGPSPVDDTRHRRSSSANGRPTSRLSIDAKAEQRDKRNQYDLTPVGNSNQDSPRALTPSYSIDPWEVAVSPESQGDSLDSGRSQHNIVDRTPGDPADSPRHPSFDDDQGDEGYDPDVDEDDDLILEESDPGHVVVEDAVDGVARSANPANRFLVPSDIRKYPTKTLVVVISFVSR